MAGTYRELFDVPGVRLFVPAAFIGRMTMSMLGIGIVLLVSSVTGSYGIAGSVSATCSVAFAVTTPFVSRLTDRHGQQRVLVPLLSLHAISMAALVGATWAGAPTWSFYPAAAAVGITSPSLGAMIRARWSYVLRDGDAGAGPADDTRKKPDHRTPDRTGPDRTGADRTGPDHAGPDRTPDAGGAAGRPPRPDFAARLQAAYSLESVLDELVFVTGPVIVTMLVVHLDPLAGVSAAAACAVIGGLTLAAQRRTQPPPSAPRAGGPDGGVVATPAMFLVTGAFLLLGVVFGAVDVSVIAYAKEQGRQSMAGVVLGVYALGSGAAGLWYGGRQWNAPLDRRFAAGLLLTAAGLAPMSLMPGLAPLIALVFFAGMGISPTIIAGYGLVERLAPTERLTEALTWVSTAVGIGVAGGAAVAGRLADVEGARAGLLAALLACLAAAAVGITGAVRARASGAGPATAAATTAAAADEPVPPDGHGPAEGREGGTRASA